MERLAEGRVRGFRLRIRKLFWQAFQSAGTEVTKLNYQKSEQAARFQVARYKSSHQTPETPNEFSPARAARFPPIPLRTFASLMKLS